MTARRPILDPGTCGHCQRKVIWGLLQNGRYRTFEAQPKPSAEVVERDRYAVSKRLGRIVDLVGIAHPPALVLAAHYCAEYREAKRNEGVDGLGEALDAIFGSRS